MRVPELLTILNESMFRKAIQFVQGGLSKLGSAKVGGKVFRREETRQQAEEDYQALVSNLDEITGKIMKDF